MAPVGAKRGTGYTPPPRSAVHLSNRQKSLNPAFKTYKSSESQDSKIFVYVLT